MPVLTSSEVTTDIGTYTLELNLQGWVVIDPEGNEVLPEPVRTPRKATEAAIAHAKRKTNPDSRASAGLGVRYQAEHNWCTGTTIQILDATHPDNIERWGQDGTRWALYCVDHDEGKVCKKGWPEANRDKVRPDLWCHACSLLPMRWHAVRNPHTATELAVLRVKARENKTLYPGLLEGVKAPWVAACLSHIQGVQFDDVDEAHQARKDPANLCTRCAEIIANQQARQS